VVVLAIAATAGVAWLHFGLSVVRGFETTGWAK